MNGIVVRIGKHLSRSEPDDFDRAMEEHERRDPGFHQRLHDKLQEMYPGGAMPADLKS